MSGIQSGERVLLAVGGAAIGAAVVLWLKGRDSSTSTSTRLETTFRRGSSEDVGTIVIGYWKIRGLAAPLRMICEYVGAKYEDRLFELHESPGGGWDVQEWTAVVKPQIKQKNAFANLPYLEHQGEFICQSNACLRYLGELFNLNGDSPKEQWRNDQAINEIMDMRNTATKLFYMSQQEFDASVLSYFEKTLSNSYHKMELWLAQHALPFLSAERPLVADFHLFEMIDQHEILSKRIGRRMSPLDGHPCLIAFYNRFRSLPQLQRYFSSDAYKLPVNNKMSPFQ